MTAGVVVNVIVLWWLSEPLVAVKVSVALPVGVESDVATVNDCGDPGLRLKAPAGLATAPGGRPETVTDTLPLNPSEGITEIMTAAVVPPTGVITDDGDVDNEKSGGGGPEEDDPPPVHEEQSSPTQTKPTILRPVPMNQV